MAYKQLDQKYLNSIRDEFNRVLFYEGKYASHIERATKMLMSAGATQNSLYGLFPPHSDINILTDRTKLGKLVSVEKNIDFKYYFDSQDRVILIERFDPTSQYQDKLVNTIFVEYEERRAINVLFCKGRTESIYTVAQCKLDLYGRLIRYLECTCGVNGYPYVYSIMRLKHQGERDDIRHSVYSIWQEGEEILTSERKYIKKRGQLREI